MTGTNTTSTEIDESTSKTDFERGVGPTLDRRSLLGTIALAIATPPLATTASAQTAEELVAELSLEEKIGMVHGHEATPTGYIPGIDRLGIPEIAMLDGPVGVRTETDEAMTAFPASIAIAASFDPELMYEQGRAMGREAKAVDTHCLLGPALNVHRVPTCGRNFEYYSEDPYLTARMAANSTEGVQDENVVATPKHYVANSQETDRRDVNAAVSERALREIYLPGFKAAVQEGDAGAVMSAYNGVNGENCSENEFLLTDVLKNEWGFDGFVVSDWDAIEESVPAANAGLDLDMPGDVNWGEDYFDTDLRPAVESGAVSESRLDEMVARILHSFAETGHLEGDIGSGEANTAAHQNLAREIAEQSIVLLKNEDDVLPIDVDEIDSVAVVGPTAEQAIVGGGGAAEVEPPYAVSPLEAIRDAVGQDVDVRTATNSREVEGTAADADVVLAFGHVDSSEFEDRPDMHLDGDQDDVIQTAAGANPNTVAVLRIPGPIEMPWLEDVAGVVTTWYPGMEAGTATANVLFGEVNPTGKLPTTFGRSLDDYPASEERQYPGVGDEVHFDEGVFVGYRHFDEEGIEPLFPFGFGLSYTDFEYSSLECPAQVDPEGTATVSVDVTNVGDRAGGETVQIYVEELEPSVGRPPKELKGFEKVWLEAGETATVSVSLDRTAFQYWNPDTETWTVDEGSFRVHVGASSRDVRERETLEVTSDADSENGEEEPREPPAIEGTQPADTTGDGLYNDVTGSGQTTTTDVNVFFEHVDDPAITEYPDYYDFDGNGSVSVTDVVELFESI